MKNIKKRLTIFLIVYFAVALGFKLLFSEKKQPKKEGTIQPTKEPTPTRIPINPFAIAKIRAKLPLRTNDFSIVYFEDTGQFGVTIFQGPYKEKKKMVLKWFREQGVKEPEKLPIIWSASRWVTDFEE